MLAQKVEEIEKAGEYYPSQHSEQPQQYTPNNQQPMSMQTPISSLAAFRKQMQTEHERAAKRISDEYNNFANASLPNIPNCAFTFNGIVDAMCNKSFSRFTPEGAFENGLFSLVLVVMLLIIFPAKLLFIFLLIVVLLLNLFKLLHKFRTTATKVYSECNKNNNATTSATPTNKPDANKQIDGQKLQELRKRHLASATNSV